MNFRKSVLILLLELSLLLHISDIISLDQQPPQLTCDFSPNDNTDRMESTKSSAFVPSIEFLEEMAEPNDALSFIAEGSTGFQQLATDKLNQCRQQFASLLPALLASRIQKNDIVQISRWAKEQTSEMQWPPAVGNVGASLRLQATKSPNIARLSHENEQGLGLPSHNALVFRRLCFIVDYDSERDQIVKVIVTVSGWREE
jgi:hypothetical protein